MAVYRPAANGTALPIVYFHDGSLMIDKGRVPQILDRLFAAGRVPAFTAVYAPILAEPLVPKPTSMELVHAKVVPETGPPKVIAVPAAPLQCVRFATVLTVGF